LTQAVLIKYCLRQVINDLHELIGEYINVHFLNSNESRNEFNKNELIRTALINGILVYGGDHVREIMKSPVDLEGMDALSRKDALSKINKFNEYKVLSEMEKLNTENMIEVLEDIYIKIFNKKIRKGD
jgi:hypothetical protein